MKYKYLLHKEDYLVEVFCNKIFISSQIKTYALVYYRVRYFIAMRLVMKRVTLFEILESLSENKNLIQLGEEKHE